MASWRNKKTMLDIQGFDELYQQFAKAGKNAEVEGRKCFEKCAETVYDELYKKSVQAGLDEDLVEKIEEKFIERPTMWRYEVGWKKQKASTANPLPDTYKVMFYNYGTPAERVTKSGASRGQESAHPEGSHGFIKKAKLAARNKVKKIQKEALDKVLKELKR